VTCHFKQGLVLLVLHNSAVSSCSGVDVIITMLPSAQHVREVYCGQDGILKAKGTPQFMHLLIMPQGNLKLFMLPSLTMLWQLG